MLPILNLPTGAPLQGVTRPNGVALPNEDGSAGRRRLTRPSDHPSLGGGGDVRLLAFVNELRFSRGGESSLAQRWREAVRTSMAFKAQQYTRERAAMRDAIDDQKSIVADFVRAAREGGLADNQTSSWDVAEKVSARWQSLVLQSTSLDQLILRARSRVDAMNNTTDFATARTELASAIEQLAMDFRAQPVLLDAVSHVVNAFVKSPLTSSNAFLNFILMGMWATGKRRTEGEPSYREARPYKQRATPEEM
jgi:hypothetical protein